MWCRCSHLARRALIIIQFENHHGMKKKIFQVLMAILQKQVQNSEEAIDRAEESKLEEDKSSAGDKFETGRAMMQREQEMNEMQLVKTRQQITTLKKVDLNRLHQKAEMGSLVVTQQGTYFIAIGIGKVNVEGQPVLCISLDSPMGQLLQNKVEGDTFTFQNKEVRVLSVS